MMLDVSILLFFLTLLVVLCPLLLASLGDSDGSPEAAPKGLLASGDGAASAPAGRPVGQRAPGADALAWRRLMTNVARNVVDLQASLDAGAGLSGGHPSLAAARRDVDGLLSDYLVLSAVVEDAYAEAASRRPDRRRVRALLLGPSVVRTSTREVLDRRLSEDVAAVARSTPAEALAGMEAAYDRAVLSVRAASGPGFGDDFGDDFRKA